MTQPNIVSEEAVDIYEVSAALKLMEKRDGELSFRSQKTKEYIDDTKQLTDKKAKELRESIAALEIPRLKSEHVAKIIDISPYSLEDLKQLVGSFNITVKEDNLKQILSELKK